MAILKEYPSITAQLRSRFSHISVDEYLDVNIAQYLLIRELAGPSPNLCAVGDADQAIYAFRGAQVKNFLQFQDDFPGARTVRLEQNYRFTGTIIAAAQQVIEKKQPGRGPGGASGGDREMVPALLRAAVAAGAEGLYLETHPDPARAPSHAATMWPLADLPALIDAALEIWHARGAASRA